MLSLTQRLQRSHLSLRPHALHLRSYRSDAGPTPSRRRPKFQPVSMKKADDKSEWWTVDGEMHEIGDNVPHRERFHIPRVNTSNRYRKHLREQFMRRTRLVIKESEHENWCKMYMELYHELRENWEKLYWDEGYSKKHAQDHANYDSAEDDDEDFSPYRKREFNTGQVQGPDLGRTRVRQNENWNRVNQIRDKFEFDRERRMRENAFAPMTDGASPDITSRNQPYNRPDMASGNVRYNQPGFGSNNQPLDTQRYFPQAEREWRSDDD